MHVAGAQPIGSRGLSGVSVAVSDPQSAPKSFAAPTEARNAAPRAVFALTAEPVVFPREGLPVDQRPNQLRLLKASNRYREAQDLQPPHTRRNRGNQPG